MMLEMNFPKNIFVTGGCGYVGSALVSHLLRQPEIDTVTVADNLARGRLEAIGYLFEEYGDRLTFVRADIRNGDQMRQALLNNGQAPDAIVHLAATVDAPTSLDEDKRILCEQVNEEGTFQLADLAMELGVPSFIHTSSTSVYGHGRDITFTEEGPQPNPVTPYGKTKLRSERILKYNGDDMQVMVFRPASIFGYAPGYRYEVAVNLMSLYAHFGIPLTIYETAQDELRPYLSIEDAVTALVMGLMEPEKFAGSIWNVVSFNATLREIVDVITEIYPNATKTYTADVKINQISFAVSGQKLYNIGFEPQGDLKKALLDVERHLDQFGAIFAQWASNNSKAR